MHGGSNAIAAFMKNSASLRVQGSVALKPMRGNCRRGKENRDIDIDDTPLPTYMCKKKMYKQKITLMHTEPLYIVIL